MKNVSFLSRKEKLTETYDFVMKRQMRVILWLLGAESPGKVMIDSGIRIMRDIWPFKKRRLGKLING